MMTDKNAISEQQRIAGQHRCSEAMVFELHDGAAQRRFGALMQFEAYEILECHKS